MTENVKQILDESEYLIDAFVVDLGVEDVPALREDMKNVLVAASKVFAELGEYEIAYKCMSSVPTIEKLSDKWILIVGNIVYTAIIDSKLFPF